MAKLLITTTSRDLVPAIPIVSGQIIITDEGEYFFDLGNTIRTMSRSIVPLENENDRITLLNVSDSKVYVVLDTEKVYKYSNKTWTQVYTTTEVSEILANYTEFTVHTLKENGKSIAPRTLAKAVYTDDGDKVSNILKQIRNLGMSGETITAESGSSKIYTLNSVPYSNYWNNTCNFALVFINGKLLPFSDYETNTDNTIKIISNTDSGDQIYVLYMYDSKIPNGNSVTYMDGRYISKGTINSDRLALTTSRYDNDNQSTMATASAVYALFRSLSDRIDNIDQSRDVSFVDTNNDPNRIRLVRDGYKLADGNVIRITTSCALARNCVIRINAGDDIPIYVGDEPIAYNQVNKNETINLTYSVVDNRFYMTNGNIYKITKLRNVTTVAANVKRINIGITGFQRGIDDLFVMQDNTPLIEGINYTILDNSRIELIDYRTTEVSNVFYFEVSRVGKNYGGLTSSVEDDKFVYLTDLSLIDYTETDNYKIGPDFRNGSILANKSTDTVIAGRCKVDATEKMSEVFIELIFQDTDSGELYSRVFNIVRYFETAAQVYSSDYILLDHNDMNSIRLANRLSLDPDSLPVFSNDIPILYDYDILDLAAAGVYKINSGTKNISFLLPDDEIEAIVGGILVNTIMNGTISTQVVLIAYNKLDHIYRCYEYRNHILYAGKYSAINTNYVLLKESKMTSQEIPADEISGTISDGVPIYLGDLKNLDKSNCVRYYIDKNTTGSEVFKKNDDDIILTGKINTYNVGYVHAIFADVIAQNSNGNTSYYKYTNYNLDTGDNTRLSTDYVLKEVEYVTKIN